MPRPRPIQRSIVIAVAALLIAATVGAQSVLVAPTVIFMDHQTRSGALELVNTGTEATEVTLSTMFGYPVTDSTGRITVPMWAHPDAAEPSAADWIVAYPTHIVIRPGAHQVIRLFSRAPAGLPDGEYWTRLIVSAKGGAVKLADVRAADTAAIRVGVSLEVRTVIALLYRKGPVTTGLTVGTPTARLVGDSVDVRVPLTRTGTAAFLGMLRLAVLDASGAEIAHADRQTAVYRTLDPEWRLPIDRTRRGPYRLRVTLDNERDDVPPPVRLPFAPVDTTIPITP